MATNTPDVRQYAEAIDCVRDAHVAGVSTGRWARMSDVELVERIEANAAELRAAEKRGDAEACHEHATALAAMAIEYLARGLA